jgi:hypothetical protein
MISLLRTDGPPSETWSLSAISKVFSVIFEEIIKEEFITKEEWLRVLYAIQNQSFVGIEDMEKQPMNKFLVMSEVHSQAMKKILADAGKAPE